MVEEKYSNLFLKDLHKTKKRGKDLKKIEKVIDMLIEGQPLPKKYKNHKLHGNYTGHWECHIEPDWLLIYKRKELYSFS